jgi:hypothetical protein
VTTVVSLVIGGAISWFAAHKYYVRAGNELRVEAGELRRLTTLVLRALEAGGVAKIAWANGSPSGLTFTKSVNADAEIMGETIATKLSRSDAAGETSVAGSRETPA